MPALAAGKTVAGTRGLMQTFDPVLATARLVDGLGPEALARSQEYSFGSNLLQLGGVAVWILVALVAIRIRLVERIAARLSGKPRWVSTLLAAALFFLICDLIRLPWTLVSGWGHQAAFGLSGQPVGEFLVQSGISSLFDAIVSALVVLALFGLVRRVGRRWWISAGGVLAITTAFLLLVGPGLVAPLLNRLEPVPEGPVRVELERIARQAGIPDDKIFLYEDSHQPDVFTARVGGIGPGVRMLVSKAALTAPLDEVRAVAAHEAGHYALGHPWRNALVIPLLGIVLLFLLDRLYPACARLMRSNAQLGELASLPVFVALGAVLLLAASPLVNAISRYDESAADRYALETTREPDALASALLRTADTRDPRPSWVEEVLFYSHPPLRNRILAIMEWKAAHLPPPSSEATSGE